MKLNFRLNAPQRLLPINNNGLHTFGFNALLSHVAGVNVAVLIAIAIVLAKCREIVTNKKLMLKQTCTQKR